MTDRSADVTRLVDRLVRDGLAGRVHDYTDRRVVRVMLTESGQALLTRLDEPLVDLHRRQLGHLSEEELDTLIALLKKARRHG